MSVTGSVEGSGALGGGGGGAEADASGSAEANAGGEEGADERGPGRGNQMPAFVMEPQHLAQIQTQRAIWAPYDDAQAEEDEDDAFEGGVGLRLQASSNWTGFSIV